MPDGNAIELFNCSLCSFCETSLDRLAHHIRQHIKPDPGDIISPVLPKESIVTPRGYQNGSRDIDKYQVEGHQSTESASIGVLARKSAATENFDGKVKDVLNQTATTDSEDVNTSLANVEVTDVRSSNPNTAMDVDRNTSASSQLDKTPFIPPPPLLVEKSPHVNPYPRNMSLHNGRHSDMHVLQSMQPSRHDNMQPSRHDNIPPARHEPMQTSRNETMHTGRHEGLLTSRPENMQSNRHENIHVSPRYIPVQPREHEHPALYDSAAHRAFNPQPYPPSYVNSKSNQYVTEFVPIAPAKAPNSYREIQPMPVDGHIDAYRRPVPPPHDRNSNLHHKNVLPAQNPRSAGALPSDNRRHPTQPYDPAQRYNYPVRMPQSHDELYHNSHAMHSHVSPKMRPVPQQQPPPISHGYRAPYQPQDLVQADLRTKPGTQVQSRLSGLQYADIKSQQTANPIGIPNSGTVILNPDQLLSATGNVSLDQLAGLLIVPLKKTVDMSTQTDPVEITSQFAGSASKNVTSSCVQTDLKMGQISEQIMAPKSTSPVFDNLRSTDNLFECLVCGEELASDHHLQEHISINHTHVCEKCYHSSTNLNEHNTHVQDCGKLMAEMLCMECNSSFTSVKKFNLHRIKVHNVRMPFRCGICNIPFETHEAVMKHINTHDSELPEFKCRHCVKVFQTAEALSRHFLRHKTVEVLHECRFCKKTFSQDSLLQDHISYFHVITEPKDGVKGDAQYIHGGPQKNKEARNDLGSMAKKHQLCRFCDLAFKNRELLRRHSGICSKNRDAEVSPYACDVCKEYFQSDILRKQHLKQDHRRANGYRCPKCSKIYRTWSRLKFHTKQQHLKKTCSECGLVFTKEHILRKHQEEVHGKPQGQPGERVYTCSLCNTMLHTLTDLMNHRRDVHPELLANKGANQYSSATMLDLNEDNFNDAEDNDLTVSKCPECSEIFTTKKVLNEHIQEKHRSSAHQFKCDHCSSSFDEEKRLKNHLGLIHGERPFECKVCDKKFQYSSQVIWHMRCHRLNNGTAGKSSLGSVWKAKTKISSFQNKASVQNFRCEFCGTKFNQEKLLKNHKGTVHKIKLFSCDLCKTKFGHSTELIWHTRTCRAKFQRQNPGAEIPSASKEESKQTNENFSDDYPPTMASADISKDHYPDDGEFNDSMSSQYLPDDESADRVSMVAPKGRDSSHLQLNSLDGQELLRNEPEFDPTIGEYLCPICQKTTKSVTGMKTHYGRCHGVWGKETSHRNSERRQVAIYPCKLCDKEFTDFEEIKKHGKSEHGMEITLDQVSVEWRLESSIDRPVTVYTCPHCHVSFNDTKAIRVHSFKKHGILLNDEMLKSWKAGGDDSSSNTPEYVSEDQIVYNCLRCKAKFYNTKAIRIHSFKRHGHILSKKEVIKCKQMVSSSEIPSPVINRNKGRDLVDEPNPCDKCGRVFGNYRALFTHYRQAHRIMNVNFVPRKPSRTELPSDFSPPPESIAIDTKSDSYMTPPPTANIHASHSPTASSVNCPKCDRAFTVHKSLVAHLYSAHKISKEQYADYWPNGIPVLPRISSNCPKCDKECVDNRAMRIHMFKAHGVHYRDLSIDDPTLDDDISKELKTEFSSEALIHDETKLSVDVDINAPPICFICDRLFKGRRALMTHEHKFHGIRWVNLKRVFPERVKNMPSAEKPVTKESLNGSVRDADVTSMFNNVLMNSGEGYICPECDAKYHNRRAMTTHLCRIHKYKKDDIHAYFGMKPDGSPLSPKFDVDDIIDDEESDNLVIVDPTEDNSDVTRSTSLDMEENVVANDTPVDDVEMIKDIADVTAIADFKETNNNTEHGTFGARVTEINGHDTEENGHGTEGTGDSADCVMDVANDDNLKKGKEDFFQNYQKNIDQEVRY